MERPSHVLVVGSGAASLTAALLFAKSGIRTTLAEAAPCFGGAMRGFVRNGLAFDTGFHFTGGMNEGGAFDRLLRLLGVREKLSTEPVQTMFRFRDAGRSYLLPRGHEAVRDWLADRFPEQRAGIFRYFAEERDAFERTSLLTSLRLDAFGFIPGADNVALSEKLKSLNLSGECAAILSAFMTCYGTPPEEITFADHARICFNMFDDLVRFQGGGQALADVLLAEARSSGVELLAKAEVVALEGAERSRASCAVLADGKRIPFDACVLGVHPKTILNLLPEPRRALLSERVAELRESSGLFTAYFRIDGAPVANQFCASFENPDVGSVYRGRGEESVGFMIAREKAGCSLIAFQCENADDPVAERNPSYDAFKRRRLQKVLHLVSEARPDLQGRLIPLAAATSLTCRDWLHSPYGSAYGVRHEIGKPGIFGRLPLRNCYAVGQNALLPGVLGAMLSSAALWQKVCGTDRLSALPEI